MDISESAAGAVKFSDPAEAQSDEQMIKGDIQQVEGDLKNWSYNC